MRIIKPYGVSATRRKNANSNTLTQPTRAAEDKPYARILRPRQTLKDVSLKDFVNQNENLTIALWISTIDKIVNKKLEKEKPTKLQRQLRDCLGKAARYQVKTRLNQDLNKEIWEKKIHPYKKGLANGDYDIKGRWYSRFTNLNPDKVDDAEAKKIAERIYQHLYENALSFSEKEQYKNKGKGRIENIIRSIEGNVLYDKKDKLIQFWSESVQSVYDTYKQKIGFDLAKHIKNDIVTKEGQASRWNIAVARIYEAYGKIFKDENGNLLSISQASQDQNYSDLFELHKTIKNIYLWLLKKRCYKKESLPDNWEALSRLVSARTKNQNINERIRRGRIIHYEARQENVIDWIKAHHRDDTLKESDYWLSDRQAEIKRNEALVRIWRRIITLASQTLHDWKGRSTRESDILWEKKIEYDQEKYHKKLYAIFGENGCIFDKNKESNKMVLEMMHEGWKELRNNTFHFKMIKTFSNSLRELGNKTTPAFQNLWNKDISNFRKRLTNIMNASNFKLFISQKQAETFVKSYYSASPSKTPMPNFRRVLDRAKNAWSTKENNLKLPQRYNQLESCKWLKCQYITLNLLYRRVFPNWLEKNDGNYLRKWIETAENRSTNAAQSLNKKATNFDLYKDTTTNINMFMDELAAATATEMRVCRGYKPDPDQAREQASYIEKRRCDVVAQAFSKFLHKEEFEWVLTEKAPVPTTEFDPKKIPPPDINNEVTVEPWMQKLYFLIHLVPVEEVNVLYNQLQKFTVLTSEKDSLLQELFVVFQLYLDMHNAQFVGCTIPENQTNDLLQFFENKEDFEKIFPRGNNDSSYRGLREMLRFGNQSALTKIFVQHKVTQKQCNEFQATGKGEITSAHNERQKLHQKLNQKKPKEIEHEEDEYKRLLDSLTRYRQLKNHVTLTNHVRLHRLLMKVLGRFVDYAGLWERDCYFILLELLYRNKVGRVFKDDFRENLENRQIVKCVKHLDVADKKKFNDIFPIGREIIDYRNNFMHFNMLHQNNKNTHPNLTTDVNKMRDLMSYDRKLKNTVSKSIIELLHQDGLCLTWGTNDKHKLVHAQIHAREIIHLKNNKLSETLHGQEYVSMVAKLFDGSICDIKECRKCSTNIKNYKRR